MWSHCLCPNTPPMDTVRGLPYGKWGSSTPFHRAHIQFCQLSGTSLPDMGWPQHFWCNWKESDSNTKWKTDSWCETPFMSSAFYTFSIFCSAIICFWRKWCCFRMFYWICQNWRGKFKQNADNNLASLSNSNFLVQLQFFGQSPFPWFSMI